MSLDRPLLQRLVSAHGRVMRVVVAETRGSVPREVGAAMHVWPEGAGHGQTGTIGGGALEYEAARRACALTGSAPRLDRIPLGPGLGQCCGGAVTLVTEVWTAESLDRLPADATHHLRPIDATGEPLSVQRLRRRLRNGEPAVPRLVDGWLLEPLTPPAQDLWLWGAGHVGRAIGAVLAPLPDWRITWVDTAAARFPPLPAGVTRRLAALPQDLVAEAPAGAHHLILTYSHALDLELCHRLLGHGFASCGVIGSATKWARFRSRLAALGHAAPDRIVCPIGDPALGKHPQAIAIGTAAALIRDRRVAAAAEVRQA